MSDPFDHLVPEARAFLGELAQNNTRDWFMDNKPRFDQQLKQPATLMLDIIAGKLRALSKDPVTTKLFRPHRDVRFSKDKTPYHTHLHLLWTTNTGGRQPLGWFFGVAPDYVSVGAGLMGFEKETLIAWRETLDSPKGDQLADIISSLTSRGLTMAEPTLKRVPPPYAKDHVHGDLLRRKGMSMWREISVDDIKKGGLTNTIMTALSELKPLQDALRPLL